MSSEERSRKGNIPRYKFLTNEISDKLKILDENKPYFNVSNRNSEIVKL